MGSAYQWLWRHSTPNLSQNYSHDIVFYLNGFFLSIYNMLNQIMLYVYTKNLMGVNIFFQFIFVRIIVLYLVCYLASQVCCSWWCHRHYTLMSSGVVLLSQGRTGQCCCGTAQSQVGRKHQVCPKWDILKLRTAPDPGEADMKGC